MDISNLETTDTAECVIVHPVTGVDTDIKITLYGVDSKKFREVSLARARANREDDNDEDSREADLASVTLGWENVELNGKELEFSHANAVKVYKLVSPIRNQVDSFIVKTANFLKKA